MKFNTETKTYGTLYDLKESSELKQAEKAIEKILYNYGEVLNEGMQLRFCDCLAVIKLLKGYN